MFHAGNTYKYYIRPKEIKIPDKWELIRFVAKKSLSDKALLKLEWIIFYHTKGKNNVVGTAKYFGITRKTVHKWLARFKETNLLTLEEAGA